MVFVTGTTRFDARDFLTKRFVRVVPFYWCITLLTAALAVLAPSAFKATVVTAGHLFASLLFIPMYNPGEPTGILPLIKLGWTLNYEMFFYAVFACFAFVSMRARILAVGTLFAGLIYLGQTVDFPGAAPRFYTNFILMSFVAGAVLGSIFLTVDFRTIPAVAAWAAALGCLFLLGASYQYERDGLHSYSLARTTIMIGFCALLLVIGLWLERTGRLARSRLLHFIGDASYSIYLAHLFGVGFVVVAARKLGFPPGAGTYWSTVVLAFGAGLSMGCLSYLWLEKPLIAFFRRRVGLARGGRAAQSRPLVSR